MPVASTSRRTKSNRRRDPSSDAIEEDSPSQQERSEEVDEGDQDADEDEQEPQARRISRSLKKERKQKAVHETEEEVDNPLENFGDQPLEKGQAVKLAGIASDWAMMRKQIHGHAYTLVRDVASSFAEFMEGEKGEKALVDTDTIMRELIDTENELLAHEKVLNELNQKISRTEPISDVVHRYQEEVKRRLSDYCAKTTRQKYAKSEDYATFRQAIFEVQNPETAMPPVADLLPREDGDDSDDDDDVQIGGVTQDYRCPLTLTILVDPLTSELCGHTFSGEAITDFLGPSRTERKKCPASGCNKMICLSDLKPNKELAKKAKDAARRERMREEDSDEEVVE
ncbi:hypothetical protein AcV5_007833 [Taiwanofungus camphoratus]|nr:hypothetical protein AcV5_007833 [Antrodia cinnamomea]